MTEPMAEPSIKIWHLELGSTREEGQRMAVLFYGSIKLPHIIQLLDAMTNV